MPDENKNQNPDGNGSEPTGRSSAFSADYVKELREEAASWRTKYRDMETKVQSLEDSIKQTVTSTTIKDELSKRGLDIDPKFIELKDGVEVSKAVDNFLEKYPQFGNHEQHSKQERRTFSPIAPKKENSNKQPRRATMMDIKNDPIARAKLRDEYRQMLGRND